MKIRFIQGLLASIIILLASCEYKFIEPDKGEPVDPEVPISFSAEVEPIWTTQGCVSCHPDAGGLDLTVGKAYNSLQTGDRINMETPSESLILTFKTVKPGPHGNANYVGNQAEIIKVWIEQGAENN